MYRNYLKTAWRNLAGNKGYTALNIFGLATGMAVALLIGLWASFEISYDKFLPDYNRLYQVRRNYNSNGEILNFATTSLRLAEALRNDIPEIEYVAETDWMGSHGLMAGDKKIYIDGGITGTDFLKMFRYPLLEGEAATVFKDPYSIVLAESTAKMLFGSESAVNKVVRFDNTHNLKVTGILKDLPANSTFHFKYLVPFSFLDAAFPGIKEDRTGSFRNNSFQQFVKLKPGVTYAQVAPKIKDITKVEKAPNTLNSTVILQPMANWHLYGNYVNGIEYGGYLEYVKMFSIIGGLVLLIACINFINLTTARSEKRAREVGVRKAIGSLRKDLIIQFLLESLLLTCIASILSILFVLAALPMFNSLTGSEIKFPFSSGTFWLILALGVAITAIFAGCRPAFYLSSFQPVKVLKGSIRTGRAASVPRKVLVVVQFTASIALITSTIIIYQQIKHARNRPLDIH